MTRSTTRYRSQNSSIGTADVNFASVSAGNESNGIAEFRYGAAPANGPAWRLYRKFADRDAQKSVTGTSTGDSIRRGQTGFRLDGGSATATSWLLKGGLFHSVDDLPDRDSGEFTNGSLQSRWSRPLSATSRLTIQAYFRREYRRIPLQLTHALNTVDVDG